MKQFIIALFFILLSFNVFGAGSCGHSHHGDFVMPTYENTNLTFTTANDFFHAKYKSLIGYRNKFKEQPSKMMAHLYSPVEAGLEFDASISCQQGSDKLSIYRFYCAIIIDGLTGPTEAEGLKLNFSRNMFESPRQIYRVRKNILFTNTLMDGYIEIDNGEIIGLEFDLKVRPKNLVDKIIKKDGLTVGKFSI